MALHLDQTHYRLLVSAVLVQVNVSSQEDYQLDSPTAEPVEDI